MGATVLGTSPVMNVLLTSLTTRLWPRLKVLFAACALSAGLLTAGQAGATPAVTDRAVNLRTGPSTGYPSIAVIPRGDYVEVNACLESSPWCDVDWRGVQGWAYGRYLLYTGARYRYVPIYDVYRYVGIGIYIGRPIIYPRYRKWHRRPRYDRPPPGPGPRPPRYPIERPGPWPRVEPVEPVPDMPVPEMPDPGLPIIGDQPRPGPRVGPGIEDQRPWPDAPMGGMR